MCRTEVYHIPTLEGLKLVKGLCDGVQLGIKAMAGFPSLKTLPHTSDLTQHGVNVFNSESKYVDIQIRFLISIVFNDVNVYVEMTLWLLRYLIHLKIKRLKI